MQQTGWLRYYDMIDGEENRRQKVYKYVIEIGDSRRVSKHPVVGIYGCPIGNCDQTFHCYSGPIKGPINLDHASGGN